MLPNKKERPSRPVKVVSVGFDGVVRAAENSMRSNDSNNNNGSDGASGPASEVDRRFNQSVSDMSLDPIGEADELSANDSGSFHRRVDTAFGINSYNPQSNNSINHKTSNSSTNRNASNNSVNCDPPNSNGMNRNTPTDSMRSSASFLNAGKAAGGCGCNNLLDSSGEIHVRFSGSVHNSDGVKSIRRRCSMIDKEKLNKMKQSEDESMEFKHWGGRKTMAHQSSIRRMVKQKVPQLEAQIQEFEHKFDEDSASELSIKLEEEGKKPKPGLWKRCRRSCKRKRNTYEKLMKLDNNRERIAEQCDEPFYRILFHFRGTVLRVISTDVLFWTTIAIFIAVRCYIRMSSSEVNVNEYENLSSNLVYVGGFMTFFLVFYVNQNHSRYFELHKESMVLMGRVNDVATMVKACMPIDRAHRIVRFMNTAHVCTYTGLSDTYTRANFLDPLDERFALLTDAEYKRIAVDLDVDCGPKAVFEVLTWVMMDITDAQDNRCINYMEAKQLREQVLQFRSTIAKIFVTCTLPIPFFYIHFLSLLTVCYLPLFAIVVSYQTGDSKNHWGHEALSLLVVALQALFTIGLRSLGQRLSDPYGGDTIDLQVARYVVMILNGSNQILSAKRLPKVSRCVEQELREGMASVGKAYEGIEDEEGNSFL